MVIITKASGPAQPTQPTQPAQPALAMSYDIKPAAAAATDTNLISQYLISSDDKGNLMNTNIKWNNNGNLMTNNGYFETTNSGIIIGNSDKNSNKWIFHAPIDDRKTLFIAPQTVYGSNWKWDKQVTIDSDGNLVVKGMNIVNEINDIKRRLSGEQTMRNTATNFDEIGNSHIYLDRQGVWCGADEFLSGFKLGHNGRGQMRYDFRCSKIKS